MCDRTRGPPSPADRSDQERAMTYPGPQQPAAGDPHGAPDQPAWGQPPGPYGGYPPGYGQPPYGGYPYAPPRRTNGMAVASMVLGILWLYWIGSILALVFGYVAKQQIRQRGDSGSGMATAGIVLGWVGIGFLVLGLVFGLARTSSGY
ncbi:hypothetical protein DQ241_01120 [Blastococcus sp. TF02A-30]|nr:hypothetical protein DQ241_01120 [Blastococcus sp. TF02A-30]